MTQPKFKVKRGDLVKVITGKYKGETGSVTKVLLDEAKVIVEGINVVTRRAKPSHTNPDGPYQITRPIHISNVAIVDSNGTTSKVGYKIEDGKKVRFFKKTGELV